MEIVVALILAYGILIPEGLACLFVHVVGAHSYNEMDGIVDKLLKHIQKNELREIERLCEDAKKTETGIPAAMLRMLAAKTPEESYEEMVLYKGHVRKGLKRSPFLRLGLPYLLFNIAVSAGLMFLAGFVPWVVALIAFAWLIAMGMAAGPALMIWGGRNTTKEFVKRIDEVQETLEEAKARRYVGKKPSPDSDLFTQV